MSDSRNRPDSPGGGPGQPGPQTGYLVGVGMGPDTVTGEGWRAIEAAEVLLGAPRLLDGFRDLGKPMVTAYEPGRVAAWARSTAAETFAVLLSGDVGFFSAAAGLEQALTFCRVVPVPGVSSLVYFSARLHRPWQTAAVLSCHGREGKLVETVRRNRETFVLTGGNVPALVDALQKADFGTLPVFVGENLGYATERIVQTTIDELEGQTVASLAVLLIENPAPDARCPVGLPDGAFQRGAVPMTKAAVRAVILSQLAPRPTDICADIGAGTGSVTVELALSAWQGQVYAVEHKAEALALIGANCRRFHVGNVTVVPGTAPQDCQDLPRLDVAFVGGSGGQLRAILDWLLTRHPGIRVVVSAIALETVTAALAAFSAQELPCEVIQVGVSRGTAAGNLHLLQAQNPIFLVRGGGTA